MILINPPLINKLSAYPPSKQKSLLHHKLGITWNEQIMVHFVGSVGDDLYSNIQKKLVI